MVPLTLLFLVGTHAIRESASMIQAQLLTKGAPERQEMQVPRILHRVMIPRTDGRLQCHGNAGAGSVSEAFERTRKHFHEHNAGWEEYVWGPESINALLESSKDLFRKHGLEVYADKFDSMELWMFQQDSIRHLILYHFGGLYMDLDMDCQVDVLDIIGNNSLVIRHGGKTNFLAGVPHHGFFLSMLKHVADALQVDGAQHLSPTIVSGEKQICNTLDDEYQIVCWWQTKEGIVYQNGTKGHRGIVNLPEPGSIKMAGLQEVNNGKSGTYPCAHDSLKSWTAIGLTTVAKTPAPEAQNARLCESVYDNRTTWGPELIAKLGQ